MNSQLCILECLTDCYAINYYYQISYETSRAIGGTQCSDNVFPGNLSFQKSTKGRRGCKDKIPATQFMEYFEKKRAIQSIRKDKCHADDYHTLD